MHVQPYSPLMRSLQPSLQQRSHSVRQRQQVLSNISGLMHNDVLVALGGQSFVAAPAISAHYATRLHALLNSQYQTRRRHIFYPSKANTPDVVVSIFNCNKVDFSTEHWYEKLKKAGYDPSKKSIFLWEGVTLYLSEKDVRNTLKEIKQHAASGSIIIADLYATVFVTGEMYPTMKTQMKSLKITDEEFGFGIDFSSDYENALKTFLESENIKAGDTYFMGYKTKKGTCMVVAEIII